MSEMLAKSIDLASAQFELAGDTAPGLSHVVGRHGSSDRLGSNNLRALISMSTRIADAVAIVATGLLAYALSQNEIDRIRFYTSELVTAALLSGVYFNYVGLYSVTSLRSLSNQLSKVAGAFTAVVGTLLILSYLLKISSDISRVWSILWFALALTALILIRLAVWQSIKSLYRAGWFATPIAVVGARESLRRLMPLLSSEAGKTIRLIGIYDTDEPNFSAFEQIALASRSASIDEVLIPLPWTNDLPLEALLRPLRNLPIAVRLIPEIPRTTFSCLSFGERCGLPAISVIERPLTDFQTALKRAEDLVISSIALAFAAPPMLVICMLIKLDSPGPILFRQDRWGFNARKISVLKFRTMKMNSGDDPGVTQAARNDPRVTRVGRILRRTSLDELPQLLNVLRGDMSLVGPRPHAVAHNERYVALIDNYLGRHRVKPGITGLAQVNGCRGITDTLDKMERRVAFDLHYIDTWSIFLDLKVMVMTLFVGFVNRNAF
ncbi:MAG: undecaprenyl-phosphate glucose phosphotransferase [Rhodospirillales bacterium]|nr:undecaprenyl-phosphate glucose phosphotransferase [Rhodospirillales bacterium]